MSVSSEESGGRAVPPRYGFKKPSTREREEMEREARERNVALMRERVANGLDIYTGEPRIKQW